MRIKITIDRRYDDELFADMTDEEIMRELTEDPGDLLGEGAKWEITRGGEGL